MTAARIVKTPDGPALLIPAGPARQVVAAIGRLLEVRPEFAGPDRVLMPLRRLLLQVEEDHGAGRGFGGESTDTRVAQSVGVSTEVAARRLGISPQAVRSRARLGRIPGAEQIDGRTWVIPAEALPEPENEDAADPHDHAA